jgi:hypothetical protein
LPSATGANVEKSMLTGGLVGGAIASAPEDCKHIVGRRGKCKVNFHVFRHGDCFKPKKLLLRSIADAIIAEAQGVDGFGSALGKSLVSRGVGTVVANQAVNLVSNNITQDPESLRFVFDTTRGAAGVAVNAALNKQDVGDALKFAAPSIILQASLSFSEVPETDADRITAIIEDQLQTGGISGDGVQVAAGDGVSGLASAPPELQAEIDDTETALANAEQAYQDNPDAKHVRFY